MSFSAKCYACGWQVAGSHLPERCPHCNTHWERFWDEYLPHDVPDDLGRLSLDVEACYEWCEVGPAIEFKRKRARLWIAQLEGFAHYLRDGLNEDGPT